MRIPLFARHITSYTAALIIAGCSASAIASSHQQQPIPPTANGGASQGFALSTSIDASNNPNGSPELLAVNSNTGALEYWPISINGGKHPQALSQPGVFDGAGLAAFGHIVAFANQYPRRGH